MLCKTIGDNQSKVTFLFFNGFGSDYTFWDNLVPKFINFNCVMLSENYFYGEDVIPHKFEALLDSRYLVGVGHSLGYEKLCVLQQKYDFMKLRKIVSVEGFSRYLGNNPIFRPYRKIAVDYMKVNYAVDTLGTLLGFQMFCGQFPPLIPLAINKQIFFDDLQLLDTGIIPPAIPHLVLSSMDDPVVPFFIIEDNFRSLPDVEIVYTQGAGHLLGLRESTWVYRKIMDFVFKDIEL